MSVLLEVAIGMVALYFLIAAACSFLLEAVHSVTNIRGKAMKLFLFEMLNGPTNRALDSWLKKLSRWLLRCVLLIFKRRQPQSLRSSNGSEFKLLDHPLLDALKKPEVWLRSKSTEPSYVPAHLISQALFDDIVTRFGRFSVPLNQKLRVVLAELLTANTTLPTSIKEAFTRLLVESNGPYVNLSNLIRIFAEHNQEIATSLEAFVSDLPEGELKDCLTHVVEIIKVGTDEDKFLELLRPMLPSKELSFEIIQSIVRGGALPISLTRSLQTILNASNYDLQQLNVGVERWYDSVMDRASGWFKRRSILLLGMFAFVFAALFNFDSFNIAKQLFEKPALRQSVSQLATQIVAQGDPNGSKLVPMLTLQERARANQWAKQDQDPLKPNTTKEEAIQRARETMLLTLIDPAIMAESLFLLLEEGETKPLKEKIAWQSCGKNAPSTPVRAPDVASKPVYDFPERCEAQKASLDEIDKCVFLSSAIYSWDSSLTKKSCELFRNATAGDYFEALKQWKKELEVFEDRTKILNESFLESSKLVDDIGLVWELGEQKGWWILRKDNDLSNPAEVQDWLAIVLILLVLLLEFCAIWFWRSFWPNLLFFLTIAWVIVTWTFKMEWQVAEMWPCVAGWLMTALMVSFGAPFWFDLLNKLVNRRAAGPKPVVHDGLGS